MKKKTAFFSIFFLIVVFLTSCVTTTALMFLAENRANQPEPDDGQPKLTVDSNKIYLDLADSHTIKLESTEPVTAAQVADFVEFVYEDVPLDLNGSKLVLLDDTHAVLALKNNIDNDTFLSAYEQLDDTLKNSFLFSGYRPELAYTPVSGTEELYSAIETADPVAVLAEAQSRPVAEPKPEPEPVEETVIAAVPEPEVVEPEVVEPEVVEPEVVEPEEVEPVIEEPVEIVEVAAVEEEPVEEIEVEPVEEVKWKTAETVFNPMTGLNRLYANVPRTPVAEPAAEPEPVEETVVAEVTEPEVPEPEVVEPEAVEPEEVEPVIEEPVEIVEVAAAEEEPVEEIEVEPVEEVKWKTAETVFNPLTGLSRLYASVPRTPVAEPAAEPEPVEETVIAEVAEPEVAEPEVAEPEVVEPEEVEPVIEEPVEIVEVAAVEEEPEVEEPLKIAETVFNPLTGLGSLYANVPRTPVVVPVAEPEPVEETVIAEVTEPEVAEPEVVEPEAVEPAVEEPVEIVEVAAEVEEPEVEEPLKTAETVFNPLSGLGGLYANVPRTPVVEPVAEPEPVEEPVVAEVTEPEAVEPVVEEPVETVEVAAVEEEPVAVEPAVTVIEPEEEPVEVVEVATVPEETTETPVEPEVVPEPVAEPEVHEAQPVVVITQIEPAGTKASGETAAEQPEEPAPVVEPSPIEEITVGTVGSEAAQEKEEPVLNMYFLIILALLILLAILILIIFGIARSVRERRARRGIEKEDIAVVDFMSDYSFDDGNAGNAGNAGNKVEEDSNNSPSDAEITKVEEPVEEPVFAGVAPLEVMVPEPEVDSAFLGESADFESESTDGLYDFENDEDDVDDEEDFVEDEPDEDDIAEGSVLSPEPEQETNPVRVNPFAPNPNRKKRIPPRFYHVSGRKDLPFLHKNCKKRSEFHENEIKRLDKEIEKIKGDIKHVNDKDYMVSDEEKDALNDVLKRIRARKAYCEAVVPVLNRDAEIYNSLLDIVDGKRVVDTTITSEDRQWLRKTCK